MKSTILLSVFLLLSPFLIFAQDTEALKIYHYFSEGDTLLLSGGGHIRSTPSRNGKSIDQLEVGHTLYINAEVEYEGIGEYVIQALKVGYYPVRYEKDGQWKSGYVWGGLIAQAYSYDKNGNCYIFGQRSFNVDTEELTIAVTRIDGKTKKMHEQLFQYVFGYQTGYESKVLSNMGLSQLEQIFRVGFLGEACGIYTTYYYYGWNGSQFIELPSKNSVGDAGVYHYSENMLFPTEHKLGKDLIIIESTSSTTNYVGYKEIKDQSFEVEEITKGIKVYMWNGKSTRLLEPIEVEY